jgi:hypothetical protein
VARIESICILTLAADEGWRVHHMYMKSAFLNDDLKEKVYVRQPLASSLLARRARCCNCGSHSMACDKHRGLGMQAGQHPQGDGLPAKHAQSGCAPAG